MPYTGWDGREYEDAEMDAMRRDSRPMNCTNRHIDALQRDARELERLARVLDEEGLSGASVAVACSLHELLDRIEALQEELATQTPAERLRDLLG